MLSDTGHVCAEEVTTAAAQRRLSLLHFLYSFEAGGTERHVLNLLRHHDLERFDVHVACLRRAGEFLPEIESLGYRVEEFPVNSLRQPHALHQQVRFANYLRRNRIDLVNSYGFYGNLFAIPPARMTRVKGIVASIRDIGASWSHRQLQAQRWSCRFADSILTNAEAVKAHLVASGYPAGRIAVVRNGVEISRFCSPQRESTLHQEFAIPSGSILIGVVSRIEKVKGLEFFVDAAAIIADRIKNAWFVIVGDAHPQRSRQAYKESLLERVEMRGLGGRFVFAGTREDIPEVLADLKVSVLPSLSEGFPNVVLESMAAGVPVVATAVGGTKELLENGSTGLLVPPGDPSSLAEAVLTLIQAPGLALRLAETARNRVINDFSMEKVVSATEKHYVDVLANRCRTSDDSRRGNSPNRGAAPDSSAGNDAPSGTEIGI